MAPDAEQRSLGALPLTSFPVPLLGTVERTQQVDPQPLDGLKTAPLVLHDAVDGQGGDADAVEANLITGNGGGAHNGNDSARRARRQPLALRDAVER
jgi:hypothetical protein